VYVEKPMAETAEQINDIGRCLGTSQLLMVGHLFVHHPQMNFIKNLISDGAIGKLTHITSQRLNWGIYQTKTDPLLSLATHDISIVLEFAGNNTQINQAKGWNYSNNVQQDRVWFSGTSDTVSFDIDVSWHWPIRTRKTILIGTQGQIVWDQDANTVLLAKNLIQNNRAVADAAPEMFDYNFELTPLESELKHWVDCVISRSQPTTNIDSAKSVAKVIDQVKQLL